MLDLLSHRIGWRLPGLIIKGAAYLFAACALMVYLNFQTLQDYFQARDRKAQYQTEVSQLKRDYDRLLHEQAELQSDGFEKEKAIRENLMMVRPGEQILFIEPEDGAAPPAAAGQATPQLPSPEPSTGSE